MSRNLTLILAALLLGLAAPNAFSQKDFSVRFKTGTEVFPENFAEQMASPAKPETAVNGLVFKYLQFQELPSETDRETMRALGVQFFGYARFGAYAVGLPEGFDLKNLEKFRPRSLMPVQAKWKIDPKLNERPFPKHAEIGGQIEVNAQVWPNLSIAEGAELCRFHGLNVVFEGNQNGFLTLRFFPDDLPRVAELPFVQWLELVPPPGEKEDTGGRSIHRSNMLDSDSPMGKKYNGTGINVLCRDDGIVGPHIDFAGRIVNLTQANPTATHGDGVSGIMAGTGNLDPTQKGMAAGAGLFVIDYVNHFQDNTLDLHTDNDVKITNSSYSDGCNSGYTLATQTVDEQLFENPGLMHVFSAGNNGEFECNNSYGAGQVWGNITGGHKMSKNSIATANLHADGSLESTSSRGPAYDGRLKPDIAAHGQNQGSTNPNNTYQTFGGTSGAAPGIAGCLAQLSQAYTELENGDDAPMALLKGIILNSANDMGNVGPDFKYGWGHINAHRAVRTLEEKRWLKSSVSNNGSQQFVVKVPAGVRLAKIMVYWAERQASTNNDMALVNDLDLSVNDPAGLKNWPWKLNPTPDPNILNLPAGRGRDSLNNMEQVALNDPAPGDYLVNIAGREVPFGPQEFYLVWDFLTDEITLTYPSGGESLVPGVNERIHWDAYGNGQGFEIRYAPDGQNWQTIASTTADQRMYVWPVPASVTASAKLAVVRGANSDTTDFPVNIVRVPQNLKVEKVCPDSMTVSWTKVNDSIGYHIYALGEQYMEIVGTAADTNRHTFAYKTSGGVEWLSIASAHSDGLLGRRAVATRYAGGLLNCPQPFDAAIGNILVPVGSAIVNCGAVTQQLTVSLKNEGQNDISGATVSYSTNNDPPVTESLPDLPVGQTVIYTFQNEVELLASGYLTLQVWTSFPADLVLFNDTITQVFPIFTQPISGNYSQNFQQADFPPIGWQIINPDDSFTWARIAGGVTGANGNNTAATLLNCFSYTDRGQEDHLVMQPIILDGHNKPALAFDIAHAQFNSSRRDRLRIDVFPDCDLTATPITVYDKTDPQLATTLNTQEQFYPDAEGDWRTEVVDLQQFKGQTIFIRFTGVNDFGNNIFLDNVRLVENTLQFPVADFSVEPNVLCRGDSVIFESNSTGNFLNERWVFGSQATPSAATGPGPHVVTYLIPGDKNVRLIVSNSLGADTLARTIKVFGQANASFSFTQNQNTVSFNNVSTQSVDYLWDFGDGSTSTEKNVSHTYASTGIYTVKLTASSPCKVSTKTVEINVQTIGAEDLDAGNSVKILPNPTAGDFVVELKNASPENLRLELFDATGRQVHSAEVLDKQGVVRVPFNGLNLAKGVYQLKIFSGEEVRTLSVAVQ